MGNFAHATNYSRRSQKSLIYSFMKITMCREFFLKIVDFLEIHKKKNKI